MESSNTTLLISILALLISIISVWINSLTSFKLRILNDSPTFSVYKITPNISGDKNEKTWWIPSFDMGISFYNTGRLSGKVKDIRLVAEFKGYRTERKYIFYPKWIVDYSKFHESRNDRFKWLKTSVLRDWYPILLAGQKEIHLHLILECDRWDKKESGSFDLTLEIAKKNKWNKCTQYSLSFDETIFEKNESYTAYSEEVKILRKV